MNKLTNKYIESWHYRSLPFLDLDANGEKQIEWEMSFTKWKASVRKDLNKLLKEERERIINKIESKLKNAEDKLKQPLTLALLKQIIFELKSDILKTL